MSDSLREQALKRQSYADKFREEESKRFGPLEEARELAKDILHGSGLSPHEYMDWIEAMASILRDKREEYRAFVEQFKRDNEP